MVSVPARRSTVAYATGRGLSQRRACTLLGVARSALRYGSIKAVRDAPVLKRMAELSAQYPRYGYRRIAIFLDRDGHTMSFGRAHRLWRHRERICATMLATSSRAPSAASLADDLSFAASRCRPQKMYRGR